MRKGWEGGPSPESLRYDLRSARTMFKQEIRTAARGFVSLYDAAIHDSLPVYLGAIQSFASRDQNNSS